MLIKEKILNFRSSLEINTKWDVLKTSPIIEEILLRVKNILDINWDFTQEISNLSKDLYTMSYMLDTIFNPLNKQKTQKSWNLSNLDWNEEDNESNEDNELYYYTPAIWVFLNWFPFLLSQNYVNAIWAESLDKLKKDITQWKVLEKYYTENSKIKAEKAIKELSEWKSYKNLILETKLWKKISWNSFWNKWWLEIRIWNDITNWEFSISNIKEQEILEQEDFSKIWLETSYMVDQYISQVKNILNKTELEKLEVFKNFCTILEKVWIDWQNAMNLTINDIWEEQEIYKKVLYNPNYIWLFWLKIEEAEEKIKSWYFLQKYDLLEQKTIKWMFKVLEQDWYYIHDFTMKNSFWESVTRSWFRVLIQQNILWVKRTFGIGSNSISDENFELINFLKEYKLI